MAASWDPELLADAAHVIATEVREAHESDPGVSLNVWAPVVNTLRHPLWGRTEEAYTEDPLLNAELGSGFSRGMRGEGDTWGAVPTLKHFLGYSNETDRAATSSDLSERVLHEYELPGFVEPVRRQVAGAVMLSYNLVNGRPAHLTNLLESHIRSVLPDADLLFVVSDAGAPGNLFRSQKVVPDAAHAYAAMLIAGVDSFTDNDSRPSESLEAVRAALDQGLVEETHVDRAVVRQLVARARTGEFDAAIEAADGDWTPSTLDRAGRRALSCEVATRSAVLLAQHDPTALPLSTEGSTAVLGRIAHSVLRDWYSGDLIDPVSVADALASARSTTRSTPALTRLSLVARSTGAVSGVPDAALADQDVILGPDAALRLARPAVDLDPVAIRTPEAAPAQAPTPAPTAPALFDVVELGDDLIALQHSEDGLLVAPDERGQLAVRAERIGGWVVQETFRRTEGADGDWTLQHVGSGRYVGIEHHTGALVLRTAMPASAARFDARVTLTWEQAFDTAIDDASSVVLVVGNEPHVHGRETEDRPDLRLTAQDRAAAERLAALPAGITTVLVVVSSYPVDLGGLEDRVGAVIWSSHAGECEGTALADLLSGKRDFSGRLAQTWPTSAPLPALLDYDVIRSGSTYLYGQEARFPFGHGHALDPLSWEDVQIQAGAEGLRVRLRLQPPRERRTAGPLHEVVQVYADVPAAAFSRRAFEVPATRLVGFRTVGVEQDGVEVALSIPYRDLALWADDRGGWELPDGEFTVRVARSSADTVAAHTLALPVSVRAAQPVPEAVSGPGRIPAQAATATAGLVRCASSLLEGTDLRVADPAPGASGTADFVLESGARITGIGTSAQGSPGDVAPGTAQLLGVTDGRQPAAVQALPFTVPGEADRPTARVRIRLTGPVALTHLDVERP
jgi:beta-glucosidase